MHVSGSQVSFIFIIYVLSLLSPFTGRQQAGRTALKHAITTQEQCPVKLLCSSKPLKMNRMDEMRGTHHKEAAAVNHQAVERKEEFYHIQKIIKI